jgi:hypothetical protein
MTKDKGQMTDSLGRLIQLLGHVPMTGVHISRDSGGDGGILKYHLGT